MWVNYPGHWAKWVVMLHALACSHDDVLWSDGTRPAPKETGLQQMWIYGEQLPHYTS